MTSTTATTPETAVILKTDSKGRVLIPASDREALMDAFEQSGMSGASFARLHGIRYTTFAHWRRVRRERRRSSQESKPTLFQEVAVDSPEAPGHSLTVELPGGGRFRLDRADQLPMAKALLCYLEA